MSSVIGNKIKVSVFGQSHSEAIGCVIDGLPAGFKPDMDAVNAFMQRRAPGKNKYSTSRSEADTPEIVSGLADGFTCGAPLCAIIRNTNTRSADYSDLKAKPRPSHADYPYYVKTKGFNDIRVGDFVSATYSGIIYKVLKVEHVKDKIFLDVGVCDKKGNIESENWIYRHQGIVCFNAYSPRNRKAQVV